MALQKTATATSYTENVVATPRNTQVRRVTKVSQQRFNDDWQYLENEPVSAHATNDEIFNASYKQQGLTGKINPPNKSTGTPKETYDTLSTPTPLRRNTTSQKIALTDKKNRTTASKLIAKTKASTVNASIMAWGGGLWFMVQLPFALISLVMLGLAGITVGATESSGILGWAAGAASKIVEGAAAIVGVDLSLTGISTGFFTVTYVLVLAVGLVTIFAAFFQYTLAFLKPLSGEMAGLKMGTFLIVLFGYSTPLLNLFPWIFLWMTVVWKYPK